MGHNLLWVFPENVHITWFQICPVPCKWGHLLSSERNFFPSPRRQKFPPWGECESFQEWPIIVTFTPTFVIFITVALDVHQGIVAHEPRFLRLHIQNLVGKCPSYVVRPFNPFLVLQYKYLYHNILFHQFYILHVIVQEFKLYFA